MKRAVHFGFHSRRPRRQGGYALLMVVFLGALMAVAVAAVAPNVLTQGIREKEEEMIWRGKQYTRAVMLYYRKNGRFPTSIEELEKKKTTVRYLRQAYKDPMNKEDGSWRLIYVGPGGQLIGSVTKTGAVQFPATPGAASRPGQPGQAAPGGQLLPQPTVGPRPSAQPAPLGGTGTGGQIIGGNIIGVGSKVNQTSLKAYNGRTVYREWEFIWDPVKDEQQAAPGGVIGVGVPAGTQPPPTKRPPN